MGDARQPFGARTLTTHQLEVESEGITESANHTGGFEPTVLTQNRRLGITNTQQTNTTQTNVSM